MDTSQHTSTWIGRLREGDSQAAQLLWQNYFDKLVRLAHRKLGTLPRREADGEDVALSAVNSFVQGARAGKFPQLADRDDLWRLLVTITARKATAQKRRHHADKRGGGAVRGESVFLRPGSDGEFPGIEEAIGDEPTPQFAAQVAEEMRALFDQLNDETLCQIARWRLEGYTSEEIAKKLGRNVRTVERKLALIRNCWERSAP